MLTLENDRLVFRFPDIEEEASLSISFQRTLRIPDSSEIYSLPPGLGLFPLRHVEDHESQLAPETATRGGVILPIRQAEAMWLYFINDGPEWGLKFPVAIKVAAGKINAVTGEAWRPGLHRDPQDYMVSPQQPWLDGFAIEPGVIRQFVAMPLGEGYSVEEQLTGDEQWGGLQISVTPLKVDCWRERRRAFEQRMKQALYDIAPMMSLSTSAMGMAAGGRMRQEIYPDDFELADWDTNATQRVFVTLLHAKDWKTLTGEMPPNPPLTAQEYANAGLPWFEWYGADQEALPGGKALAGIESLAGLFKKKTGFSLPGSQDVSTGAPIALGPGKKARPVRTSTDWED